MWSVLCRQSSLCYRALHRSHLSDSFPFVICVSMHLMESYALLFGASSFGPWILLTFSSAIPRACSSSPSRKYQLLLALYGVA
jgi:hypothetical protein